MTLSAAVRRYYADRIFAAGGRGEIPPAFRPLEGPATGRSAVEGCRGGGRNVLEVRLRTANGLVAAISMGCNLCNPAMYVAADVLAAWALGRAVETILAADPFDESTLDPYFAAIEATDRPPDAAEKFRYTLWAVQNALLDDRGEAPRTPRTSPEAMPRAIARRRREGEFAMLSLYNSLTRRTERFEPLHPPKVSVYACGPTVYGHVHIGNWSTFVAADVLVRWLRERYEVVYVQNITDVEDKIIRDSRAAGVDRKTFTDRWTAIYFDGLERLDARAAIDAHPRATEYISGMVEMIQALLDKGHAYVADDGSVYFRVASFPTYGELAHVDPASLRAGASGRVRADEYEKDQVADFALWKAWSDEDGDVRWSPSFVVNGIPRVLPGRPGWHIECSVMASALLGPRIDIHVGGEDLLFPHHQNEIAQSEAATGEAPFVRVWIHRRHLRVDGGKMSKSRKNFYTLDDIVERVGPDGPAALRYLIATSHYRHAIDFSWSALETARATRRGLVESRARFEKLARGAQPSSAFAEYEERFTNAMDDDLATSEAIAAVHEAVGEANRRAHGGELTAEDAAAVLALLDRADRVLGLMLRAAGPSLSPDARALLDRRAAARAARDWAESDRLRDLLRDEHGLLVKDAADGQEWSPA